MAPIADGENGPAARSFAADAHDCIMVRIQTDLPHTSVRREGAPNGELPSDDHDAVAGASKRERSPSRVHRPSACSGVKALRNTSDAKAARRQALQAFRTLASF